MYTHISSHLVQLIQPAAAAAAAHSVKLQVINLYDICCAVPPSSPLLNIISAVLLPTEIREAFKVFDRDGNGFISKQELGMAMHSLGYMPIEVELEVIIQRLDIDGRVLCLTLSLLVSNSKEHRLLLIIQHMSYRVTCSYFCHQVMVKLALKNLSHCLVQNSPLLGCLISSTEQTLIQCFGRYTLSSVSSVRSNQAYTFSFYRVH